MLPLLAASWPKTIAAVGIAAALLVLAGFGLGYGSGTSSATKEAARAMDRYKEEVRDRERTQERELAAANQRNRELERAHEKRVADLRAEFANQQAEAKARDDRTVADLRAGNQRLRLQVASCGPSLPGSPGTSSGGVDGAGTADLAPEAAATLWAIAADGDRAIRKLTALQTWATSALQACNPSENDK